MRMAEVVCVGQRNQSGLSYAAGRAFVQPAVGLDIVLRSGGHSTARGGRTEWGGAQTLEQVIGGAILLKDHHNVLEVWDLRVRDESSEPDHKQGLSQEIAVTMVSGHLRINPAARSELQDQRAANV